MNLTIYIINGGKITASVLNAWWGYLVISIRVWLFGCWCLVTTNPGDTRTTGSFAPETELRLLSTLRWTAVLGLKEIGSFLIEVTNPCWFLVATMTGDTLLDPLVVELPFGDQSWTQLLALLFSSDRPLSTLQIGQKCLCVCQREVERAIHHWGSFNGE